MLAAAAREGFCTASGWQLCLAVAGRCQRSSEEKARQFCTTTCSRTGMQLHDWPNCQTSRFPRDCSPTQSSLEYWLLIHTSHLQFKTFGALRIAILHLAEPRKPAMRECSTYCKVTVCWCSGGCGITCCSAVWSQQL